MYGQLNKIFRSAATPRRGALLDNFSRGINRLVAVIAASLAIGADGAVKSSVFDDVKIWYKGSAGNIVGTNDDGRTVPLLKSLPQLSDTSSSFHGGTYNWWGWRIRYQNEDVTCPYAGGTLASTPCVVIPQTVRRVDGSDTEMTSDPSGYVDVDVGGVVSRQPYYSGMRFGALYIDSWLSDWASGTVCSNYTIVLRFKSDVINPVSGNPNRILQLGSSWDATPGKATGIAFMLNTPDPVDGVIKEYACPRFFVGTVQKNYTDIKIKHGHWVDCALVVDRNKLTTWFCWNDGTDETPTNRLMKTSETYTGGWPTVAAQSRLYLASSAGVSTLSYTNGVYTAALNSSGAFKGAFHQIAFWERTLSDNEVREALAGGTGRPNLVHVGMEGNGIAEFATSGQATSVPNTGAWENLNPTLTAANPSATISFTCNSLLVGQPQYLRLPMAATSSAGEIVATLNGGRVGTARVLPGKVALIYVGENLITQGANTLTLTRASGDPLVLDAVTLGGSWRFANTISSFSDSRDGKEIEVRTSPDRYLFNPACGSDKLHDRSMNASAVGDKTYFSFFVPEDLVGKHRGIFTTCVQNTSGSEFLFDFIANDANLGTYKLVGGGGKGSVPTDVDVSETAIVAGWNTFAWSRQTGWANNDWHRFTVQRPPTALTLIIR